MWMIIATMHGMNNIKFVNKWKFGVSVWTHVCFENYVFLMIAVVLKTANPGERHKEAQLGTGKKK
jgi:hypothetical protein